MIFKKDITIVPTNIVYPKVMSIDSLGIVAVFMLETKCIILNSNPEDETIVYFKNSDAYTVATLKGKAFRDAELTPDSLINDESFEDDESINLMFDIKTGEVYFQDDNDAILVDSLYPADVKIGTKMDISSREWVTKAQFCSSLQVSAIVSQKNRETPPVTIENREELMIVSANTSRRFTKEDEFLFPLIFVKETTISLSNVSDLVRNKSLFSNLITFAEWKEKNPIIPIMEGQDV